MDSVAERRRWSLRGWPWLLGASLLGGVAVGALVYLSNTVLYLVVITPLAMALGGSAVITWAVTKGKTRDARLAVFFGLVTALVIVGVFNWARYTVRHSEWRDYVAYDWQKRVDELPSPQREHLNELPAADRERMFEEIITDTLQRATGSTGFLGYWKLNAKNGLEMGRWLGDSQGMLLDVQEWNIRLANAYGLLELATVVGLVVVAASVAAGRPFCTRCDDWWGGAQHICPGTGSLEQFVATAKEHSEVVYVGFWPRCAALLIDLGLLAAASAFLIPVLWPFLGMLLFTLGVVPLGGAEVTPHAGVLLAAIGAWLYFTLLESAPRQATLGKMALRLAVTDRQGRRISFARANARLGAKLLSALPLGAGFMAAEITPCHQALHDLLAGTVVARTTG